MNIPNFYKLLNLLRSQPRKKTWGALPAEQLLIIAQVFLNAFKYLL